jgi:hypothetical protein
MLKTGVDAQTFTIERFAQGEPNTLDIPENARASRSEQIARFEPKRRISKNLVSPY